MTGIGRGNCIATTQLRCERRLVNRTGEAAAAELVVAAVPVVLGQPHLETDLRVRCRLRFALHATECRNVELGLDSLHVGDANVRELDQSERGAVVGVNGKRGENRRQGSGGSRPPRHSALRSQANS